MLCKSYSHLKSVAHVLYVTGHALDYKVAINSFVTQNRDLHNYELTDYDLEAMEMINAWLKSFCTAATQLSKTKSPMLSTTHAIFHGLQEDLHDILHGLPNTIFPKLKKGLTDAHLKLSDYYYKFDESPFYTWSACGCSSLSSFTT